MTVKAAGLQALIKGADVKEAVSDPSTAGQTVQLRPSGDRSRDQRSATSLGSRSACWQVDPPHRLGSSLPPPFAPAVPTTADVLDGSCSQVPRPPVKGQARSHLSSRYSRHLDPPVVQLCGRGISPTFRGAWSAPDSRTFVQVFVVTWQQIFNVC